MTTIKPLSGRFRGRSDKNMMVSATTSGRIFVIMVLCQDQEEKAYRASFEDEEVLYRVEMLTFLREILLVKEIFQVQPPSGIVNENVEDHASLIATRTRNDAAILKRF